MGAELLGAEGALTLFPAPSAAPKGPLGVAVLAPAVVAMLPKTKPVVSRLALVLAALLVLGPRLEPAPDVPGVLVPKLIPEVEGKLCRGGKASFASEVLLLSHPKLTAGAAGAALVLVLSWGFGGGALVGGEKAAEVSMDMGEKDSGEDALSCRGAAASPFWAISVAGSAMHIIQIPQLISFTFVQGVLQLASSSPVWKY